LDLLSYKHINTRAVERHQGISRQRNQRKVRKTLAFAKVRRYHR
jgi:IS1 family transposase